MKKLFFLFLLLLTVIVSFSQNNGLHFDGVDDYVDINAPASFLSSRVFTIELWYKPTGQTDHEQTLISRGSGSQFWEIINNGKWNNASSLVFYHPISYPNEDFASVSLDFSILNQWHHVAVSSDGTTLRIYHDGRFISQDAVDGSMGSVTGPIRLGAPTGYTSFYSPSFDGGFYNGVIDEVRIWSIARTETEIKADKDNEIPSTTNGLIAYYTLNQGLICGTNSSETTLMDASGNGLNGTLTNFALSGATSNWVSGFPVAAILPVKLISFSASKRNNAIDVQWQTAEEENISRFEVEKSNDGVHFSLLGSVAPKGATSIYSFTDNTSFNGTVYYRLRTVNNDGSINLSKTVHIESAPINQLSIFPNPVLSTMRVRYAGAKNNILFVYDMQGRSVKQQYLSNASGFCTLDVSGLSAGHYVLKSGDSSMPFVKE